MLSKSTKKKRSEALAVPTTGDAIMVLPGEDAIDDVLVDQTVAEINRKYREGALETMHEIGTLIVGRFFDASTEAFRSKGRNHASFRALAERDDLDVSASTLWTSVKLVEHFELMGPELAGAISVSRHKVLAAVPDSEAKLQLAHQVADHSIGTVEQLNAAVRAVAKPADPDKKKVGRPAVAPLLKKSNALDAMLVELHRTDDAELLALGESDRRIVLIRAADASESAAAWAAWVSKLLRPD